MAANDKENMAFMGILFGSGLYLDTKDGRTIEKALQYLTDKCWHKPKSEAELEAEVLSIFKK